MKITCVLVMTGIVGLSNIFGSAEAQEENNSGHLQNRTPEVDAGGQLP